MALNHVHESDGSAEDEEPMLSTSGGGSDRALDVDCGSASEDIDGRAEVGKELRRWHDANLAPAPADCTAQPGSRTTLLLQACQAGITAQHGEPPELHS